jgi:2-polyprenyl-3-methyl-5-hydroxy-6-metoxy-1,4-benzoquinol methylase
MRRPLKRQELVHETMGDAFADALSLYDTHRRVEILVDEFLPDAVVAGKKVLDVGCGLGFFSRRLVERGAVVTACDIGTGLVERTQRYAGCEAVVADALDLRGQFGTESFDVVVSSECIEHTPDPARAIAEMLSVLRSGGHLSLSTPNIVWNPIVRLASALRLRPFDGFENFSSWSAIRQGIAAGGGTIIRERGLHLFPFQLPLHTLSAWCDERLQPLRSAMINICVLAQKGVAKA